MSSQDIELKKLIEADELPEREEVRRWFKHETGMGDTALTSVVSIVFDLFEDSVIRDADVPDSSTRSVLYTLQDEGVIRTGSVTQYDKESGYYVCHHHFILAVDKYKRWRADES